jgi:hypothetical protein
MPGTTAEERKTAKAGTVAERRAYVTARREAAWERHGDRYRLATELAGGTQTEIPTAEGFVVLPPGVVEPAGPVVDVTNDLIDSIGPERLMAEKGNKAGSIAMRFLPPEERELASAFLRFALSTEVVGPIAAYFGMIPVLLDMDAWYSVHRRDTPRGSQLWHMDPTDSTQVKVWVYCSDVGLDSGPMTVLPAAASDLLAERIDYAMDERYRVPDDVVESLKTERTVPLTAEKGSVSFVDTSSCFHFGSRVEAGGLPRRLAWFQYVTPYSFQLSDELEEAPFRELATSDSTQIERLVLGAA